MASSYAQLIRLIVPAAKAKASPAIGQALGAAGINMMNFCKSFNDATKHYVDDLPMRCSLYVQSDQSFTFVSKAPRTSFYIKAAACVEKGANKPGSEIVGAVHVKQIYEIAKIRQLDDAYMKEMPLESICKSIAAQCRGMGVDIVTDREDVLAAKEDKRLAHLAELASRSTTQADRKQKKKKRKRK
jgi:large subunit ribosomal protein L11